MGLSRSRTLFLIGLAVLIALSLSPSERVDSVVDRAFGPLRYVGVLARPLSWFSGGSVRAAERGAELAIEAERAESRSLLRAAESAATPAREDLRRGRALIPAYVMGHVEKRADELLVRFPLDADVAPGWPVVCGDAYVGRVSAIDPVHPGEGRVLLVTDKESRVGAVVESGGTCVRLVVGGLIAKALREKGAPPDLAAQFPDQRTVPSGSVRVLESATGSEPGPADGFLLGTLTTRDLRGLRVLAVHPVLDFADGLDHLAIVGPVGSSRAVEPLAFDPFDDSAWMDVSFLLAGSVSPLRATRTIAAGTSAGLRPGAALAIGARFIGRIERASPYAADASLIGDPGLSFPALARLEGRAEPFALGRLVSLGIDRESGEARLRWDAVVSSSAAEATRAELFTAAGESDVPPGLIIGHTLLPVGPGPFELRVVLAQNARTLVRVRAWRPPHGTSTRSGS